MTRTSFVLASAVAMVTAGSAILAAPQQIRPGEMTQARVWIENRNRTEAIPVTLEALGDVSKALRVEVSGTPAVTVTPTTIVRTQRVRQTWDHRAITVAAGVDVEATLRQAGSDGWEAVAVQSAPQNGMVVLLKRPR